MDSISRRGNGRLIEYQISGDPPLPHHLQTLKNAQEILGQPVILSLVLNVLKKDRLFTVEESAELARKLAEHMKIGVLDILCLETQEAVTDHLRAADKIVRRKEKGLDSDSPYIQGIAEKYDVPDYPEKIEWIQNDYPEDFTSARLKALIYYSINDEKRARREFYLKEALNMAPEFLVSAIEVKIKENPDKQHFPLHVGVKVRAILEEAA